MVHKIPLPFSLLHPFLFLLYCSNSTPARQANKAYSTAYHEWQKKAIYKFILIYRSKIVKCIEYEKRREEKRCCANEIELTHWLCDGIWTDSVCLMHIMCVCVSNYRVIKFYVHSVSVKSDFYFTCLYFALFLWCVCMQPVPKLLHLWQTFFSFLCFLFLFLLIL